MTLAILYFLFPFVTIFKKKISITPLYLRMQGPVMQKMVQGYKPWTERRKETTEEEVVVSLCVVSGVF